MSEPNSPISTSTLEYYHSLPEPSGPAPREHYWVHVLLLLATVFTTLVVGARMQFAFQQNLAPFSAGDEYLPFFQIRWALAQPSRLLLGIPFSATLLGILLAHEMGHYLASPLLQGSRHAALFYSCADHDRNAGSGHPHQVADPDAQGAVRYRDCRAHRGICRSCDHAGRGPDGVETAGCGTGSPTCG